MSGASRGSCPGSAISSVIALDLTGFHRVLIRPLMATLVMVLMLNGLCILMASATPAVRLVTGVLSGVLVYLAVSTLINRAQLVEIVSIVGSLRRRPS